MTIPSKDTIDYGRTVLVNLADAFRGRAETAGTLQHSERWRMYANVLEMELLDGTTTFVAPFDRRWLDDEFRDLMATPQGSLLATMETPA